VNNNRPKVLIITVNHKGAPSTLKFIESVKKLEARNEAYVMIVDNASADGSVRLIRQAIEGLDNVELMESPVNAGYFGGANWALLQYAARRERPDWVIVCNNDVSFDDSFFLVKLLQRDPEEAGMLAPAIVAELTGLDCNPFLRARPTRWQIQRYRFWLSHYYLMAFKQNFAPLARVVRHKLNWLRKKNVSGGRAAIYAAHGAFMVFSRRFFDQGGFIDDGFFLYAEEFCAAEICCRLRLPVVHDPDLKVSHQGHQTVGRYLSRRVFRYQQDGFGYALKRYLKEMPPFGISGREKEISVTTITGAE
jgi:GT2 family glycosyltransferase